MLTASSTLEESSLLTVGDNASPQDDQTAYVSTSDTEAVADATLGANNLSAEVPGRFTVFESSGSLNFQWEPPPNSETLLYAELDYKNSFVSTWTYSHTIDQNSFVIAGVSLGAGESYDFRLCPTYETGMGICSQITWPGVISSPSIISVTTPAAGAYRTGDVLSFDIAFDEIVYVAGTPQISLHIGGQVVLAPYVGGSGTSTLHFQYIIQGGDLDEDGISISSPVLLNGGLIRGASGWDAILTFTPPNTTGVLVNDFESSTDVSNLLIDAKSDIFSSGRSTASDAAGGLLPVEVQLPPGTGRWITFTDVIGVTQAGPGWLQVGPDGGGFAEGTNIFSSDGISGIYAPRHLFLAGVFLSTEEPLIENTPERLDLISGSTGIDFVSLAPEIHQSFFIGDGRSSNNLIQSFEVPDDATRLFLGFIDSYEFGWPDGSQPGFYGDNTGSLDASLRVFVSGPPVNRRPVLTPTTTSQLDPVAEDAGFPVGAVGTLVSSLIDASIPEAVFEFPSSVLPGSTVGTLPWGYETSGLTWHEGLQKLFTVSDAGIVSMMNADGTELKNWNVPGDLEAVTVADHESTKVYIGVENPDSILEFDVSTGLITRSFDLTDWMTGEDSRGLSALTFVPDGGHPEGGLFYAGMQSDGQIYQFALPLVSSASSEAVTFVQSMAIEQGSTDLAGLAYDSSSDLILAMFDSIDQLNVIDRAGQLKSKWSVPGSRQQAVTFIDGRLYVGDDSLATITKYPNFDRLTYSGGALDNFSDADGDLPGVAIVGTSLQGGDLYYSIDNGTTWSDVGVVSPTSALLLHADDSTRLYFEPAPDFNGTISDVLTCKAWDRTGGFNNGDTGVDTSIITGQQVSNTLDHSYAYDVVLSANNNYAYVTDGLGLNVLDITNPSSPSLVGSTQTPGIATRIALSSNEQYAFVADGREGIAVIDLTSPASPALLFNFGNDGTPILDVELSSDGNYGFATRGSGDLFVFNASEQQINSGGLSVLASLFIGYDGLGIDLVGDYLYVAHGRQEDSVITVINITNPINPSIVSSGLYGMERELSFLPFTSAVLVSNDGQHLYTAHNYLSAFDLSEPSDPTLTNISWLPHSAGVPTAWNLTMSNDGQTLFVAGKRPGVCIYDLSVPSHPEFISSLELSSPVIDLATSVNGNHLFAATGSSFLDVLDISNDESPQKLGGFKKSDFYAEQRRVTRDGRYEFRARAKSLEVLDPSTGALLHKHEFPDVSNWASRHVVLSADDKRAYVALAGDSIAVVDVSDPLSSRTLGQVPVNSWFNDLNLSSDESRLILNDDPLRYSRTYEITESTAFSIDVAIFSVAVTPVNDRPILDPSASPVLFTQATGADQPVGKVGMLVSKFIDDAGALDNFSDVDGDLPGIAMIGTNLGGGILWFSTDEGDNWTQVSQVSGQAATLLAADNKTRIYLQLGPDPESRPDTVVTFKAWDRNGYPNGAQGVDTSTESYFSEQQDDVTLDKPANILGDLSGVLTVGRVARGQFIWSDPDGSQFLSHDEWTRLTGSPEVIVPPEHGDATIFGRWSHDDQYWVTWFYDASPYFSGSDSFVIRLKDEVGGHTDQVISVTGEPGPLANYPPTVDDIGSMGTEERPQVVFNGMNAERELTGISYGNDLQPQDVRVSAESDNGAIIADVQHTPSASKAVLEFTLSQDPPGRNQFYRSTFTITIEDAGLDNDFNTVGDNAKTEILYHVEWIHMPLFFTQDGVDLTFSNDWGVLVNGIPVSMITSNHAPQILSATGIGDFRPVEATSDGADNYLLLHRGQTLNRLAANSEWQVTNLFDSLRNESSGILDVSGRAVSQTVIIASGIGAYEINGVNTPTLFVRRNQTVTFNLNAQGMPLYVQTTNAGYQASELYSAFDANGESSGQHEWVIPEDAPDELFYTMKFQPEGLGKIIVVD